MERRHCLLPAALTLALILILDSHAHAAGLNTDVALTPPKGGTIVRAQWRYTELSNDPTALNREVKLSVTPITLVHGLTENLSLLGTVPIIDRRIDFGSGTSRNDTGVGDIPLLAKYRFYQLDQHAVTTRWAFIAGAEIPSYDDTFSSDSIDPIFGTVWTHQRLNWWIDWDVLYKLNTAGGLPGDDELRADVAFSYRLAHGNSDRIGDWALYAVGEINAKYITDGSTQVFGSPGFQLITPRGILEAGLQLPILQDLASPRLETDYTAVVSLRLQF